MFCNRLQAVAFNVIYGIGFIGYFITSINSDVLKYPLMQFEEWQLAVLRASVVISALSGEVLNIGSEHIKPMSKFQYFIDLGLQYFLREILHSR